MRRLRWAFLMVVLFGVFNAGAPHEAGRRRAAARAAGDWRWTPGNVLLSLRVYLTDDSDVRRYQAYADALLGRPYNTHFVRTAVERAREVTAVDRTDDPDRAPMATTPVWPYRDFLVEYPPGIFLWILPPALLSADGDVYRIVFCSFMALLLIGAIALSLRTAAALGFGQRRDELLLTSAIGALLLGAITTHRFDAAVALLICAALGSAIARRSALAGALLALAVFSKGVPVIVAPLIILPLLRRRDFRALARFVGAAGVVGAVLTLPVLFGAGGGLFAAAQFHAARPLQLESTWAAFLGIIGSFGWVSVAAEQSFGSANLIGGAADLLRAIADPAPFAGLLLAYAFAWRRLAGSAGPVEDGQILVESAAAALGIFMTLGKVFSPQFLVWLLPLGLLASLGRSRFRGAGLLLIFGLTQLIYPAKYGALASLQPWAFVLVLVRNGLLLTWSATLLVRSPR